MTVKLWDSSALWAAFFSIIALAIFGQLIRKNEGYPLRLPEDVRRYAMDREWLKHQTNCIRKDLEEIISGDLCKIAPEDKREFRPKILAWGDSHNASIMPALEIMSDKYNTDLLFAARSSCLPLTSEKSSRKSACDQFNKQIFVTIDKYNIKDLLLAGRWSYPLYGDREEKDFTPYYSEAEFKQRLIVMLNKLSDRGVRIWLLKEVPYQAFDVPVRFTKLALKGAPTSGYELAQSEHQKRSGYIHNLFDSLQNEQIKLINPELILCQQGICKTELNGHSLYKDDDHLSVFGAHHISTVFEPLFESVR